MPIYEARCECGAKDTYFRKIAERDETPVCSCGRQMRRIVSPTRGFGDLPAYQSPITGKEVRGRRARRYDLESNGCRPYEGFDQESRAAAEHRKREQRRIDARIEDTMQRTIADLDASNRLGRVGERNDPLPPTDTRLYG